MGMQCMNIWHFTRCVSDNSRHVYSYRMQQIKGVCSRSQAKHLLKLKLTECPIVGNKITRTHLNNDLPVKTKHTRKIHVPLPYSQLWSAVDLTLLGVLRGHKRGIWCIHFSPVDQCVATGSADGTVKLWALADFSCVRTFEGHDASVLKVVFLNRGMQLFSRLV